MAAVEFFLGFHLDPLRVLTLRNKLIEPGSSEKGKVPALTSNFLTTGLGA